MIYRSRDANDFLVQSELFLRTIRAVSVKSVHNLKVKSCKYFNFKYVQILMIKSTYVVTTDNI